MGFRPEDDAVKRARDPRRVIAWMCIWAWILAIALIGIRGILFNVATLVGFLAVEKLEEHPSPDGKWILATYYIHQAMPPETDFWVSVRPAGTELRHKPRRVVAVTEFASTIDVNWKSTTHLVVTFVKGHGFYGRDEDNIYRRADQVGGIKVDVDYLENPQTIVLKPSLNTDIEKQALIGVKFYQRESGSPMKWITVAELSRVTSPFGTVVKERKDVLVLDGQYGITLKSISADGIVLAVDATDGVAQLALQDHFASFPVRVEYKDRSDPTHG